MTDYKSLRVTINDDLLIDEYEKAKYESGRSDKDIIQEALTVYLLDESEDTQLSVSKK